jgi:hypothetical protein
MDYLLTFIHSFKLSPPILRACAVLHFPYFFSGGMGMIMEQVITSLL